MNDHNQSAAELGRYARFFRKIRKASKRFIWRLKRGTKQTTKRKRSRQKARKETEETQPPVAEVKLTTADIDFFTAGDILQNDNRIDIILNSGIFRPSNARHPLIKSAFVELMVCLRDQMHKAEQYGTRISFTDHINVTPEVKDITALVTFLRDALCHVHLGHHWVVRDHIKASFIVIYGNHTSAPFRVAPNIILFGEFDDDICFYFGLQKVYLNRHIKRAFEETRKQLFPLPEFPGAQLQYRTSNR